MKGECINPLVDRLILCDLGGRPNFCLLLFHKSFPLLKETLDDGPSHVGRVQGVPDIIVKLYDEHHSFEPHLQFG